MSLFAVFRKQDDLGSYAMSFRGIFSSKEKAALYIIEQEYKDRIEEAMFYQDNESNDGSNDESNDKSNEVIPNEVRANVVRKYYLRTHLEKYQNWHEFDRHGDGAYWIRACCLDKEI